VTTQPGRIAKTAIETIVVGMFFPVNIWLANWIAGMMSRMGLLDTSWIWATATCAS
jgi:hypothetical protein